MDVARAILDRLREQTVDQLDDRRSIFGLKQVERLRGQLARDPIEPHVLEVDHQVPRRGGRGTVVGAVDGLGDNLGGRHDRVDLLAEHQAQIVERLVIGRIGDRYRHPIGVAPDRQQLVLFGVVDRNFEQQFGIERVLVDMGLEGQVIFLGERTREALRLQRAHLDQHVGNFLAGLLALPRRVEILLGDPRAVEQDRLEALTGCGHTKPLVLA